MGEMSLEKKSFSQIHEVLQTSLLLKLRATKRAAQTGDMSALGQIPIGDPGFHHEKT